MTVSYLEISNEIAYVEIGVDSRATINNTRLKLTTRHKNPEEREDVAIQFPLEITDGIAKFFWAEEIRNIDQGWYIALLEINKCPCGEFPLVVKDCDPAYFIDIYKFTGKPKCEIRPSRKLSKCEDVVIKSCENDVPLCPVPENTTPYRYTPNGN